MGLDVSRMVMTRKALQTVYDGAALAAALELDGSEDGRERARAVVSSWKEGGAFEAEAIEGATVEFWRDETGIDFIRVSGTVRMPLTLVRLAVREDAAKVGAKAKAKGGPNAELVR